MTFSPLISGTVPHHGKYSTRRAKIIRVIQHHWASNNGGGLNALVNPKTKKSVNYLILNDGKILGQVPEEFRAWTSGSAAADNPSITIECQNSTLGPEWRVSDAALSSIVRLLADVATRHKFGVIHSGNYVGHRDFAATACPGPYLWARMSTIRTNANNLINTGVEPVDKPILPPRVPPVPRVRPNCTELQRAVRTTPDNLWGPTTDKHLNALRSASRWGGHLYPFGISFAQLVVGTLRDGIWGPKSTAAHDATTKNVQASLRRMGFDPGPLDGVWGSRSESAYKSARRATHI